MTVNLSMHFTLEEMCRSDTASRQGIDNNPDTETINNLRVLCEKVLEPLRSYFNSSVHITSGYRSKRLNSTIGGATNSHHLKGMAADLHIKGKSNFEIASWIAKNLKCTQVILEFYTPGEPESGWVHVSYDPANLKNEVLTVTKTQTLKGLYG